MTELVAESAVQPSSWLDRSLGEIIPGVLGFDSLSTVVAFSALVVLLIYLVGSASAHEVVRCNILALFLFLAAVATVGAMNSILFFLAWELTALFTWGLAHLADNDDMPTNAVPIHMTGLLGSLVMATALLIGIATSRTTSFDGLAMESSIPIDRLLLVAIFLKTFGVLTLGWRRTPRQSVSLANVVVVGVAVPVVGIYPYLRFFTDLQFASPEWRNFAVPVAAGVAVVATLAAFGQSDLRKFLIYLGFAQFSNALLLLSNPVEGAVRGAMFGIATYALGMAGVAGSLALVEAEARQHNLRRLGGLAQRMPLVAATYLLSVCSLVGLPPLGGFLAASASGIALSADADALPALAWLAISALMLLTAARFFSRVFLGELRTPVSGQAPLAARAALVLVVVALVAVGLRPNDTIGWLAMAVTWQIG